MDFEEAVRTVRTHVEGKFPKTCKSCGHVYPNLAEYIARTRSVGQPMSYDAALGDWKPKKPIGTYAIAVCACGTSMAIDTTGMSLITLWRLMTFARREGRKSGETISEILERLRARLRHQVLAETRE